MKTPTEERDSADAEMSEAAKTSGDPEIDDLVAQAWIVRRSHASRSAELTRRATELARQGKFAGEPYKAGVAAAKVAQAFLDFDESKLEQAAALCQEVLANLADQEPSPTEINALVTMTWISIYGGDLATALEYAQRALTRSQAIDLPIGESSACDALAHLYSLTGDLEQGERYFQAALGICRRHGYVEREAASLNNLTETLLTGDKLEEALATAEECLELARANGLEFWEIMSAVRIGDILISMGRSNEAIAHLETARALPAAGRKTMASHYLLESLGGAYEASGQLQEASRYYQLAIESFGEIGAHLSQARCLEAMAGICEKSGEIAQALVHYKQFHELHERARGDSAAQRVAVLKITHQVETARRDAEIYRLRSIALQREIEERKEIEALLEKMATIDSLTSLNNRRHFLELAQRELERSLRYGRPYSVVLFDVDHFKQVNDIHGHDAGDQVLISVAATIRAALREVDIVGRYGGEEFVTALPETDLAGAFEASERVRKAIESLRISTPDALLSVTLSAGAADLRVVTGERRQTMGELLSAADRSLYSAKREGRNRTIRAA